MNQAIIHVTDVKFAVPLSTATFTLESTPPAGIQQIGDMFAVWQPMVLVFQFDDPSCEPVGRASFKENGSRPVNDPDGAKNLVGNSAAPNNGLPAISITNKWVDHARAPGEVRWKFSFRIQENGTGRPSLIDPEISNTNDVPDVPPGKKKSKGKGKARSDRRPRAKQKSRVGAKSARKKKTGGKKPVKKPVRRSAKRRR